LLDARMPRVAVFAERMHRHSAYSQQQCKHVVVLSVRNA
jgi:hypothetical protein